MRLGLHPKADTAWRLPGRDGSGGLCIFFRLSNNGLVPVAGGEAVEEAVPTAGRAKVKEGWVVGGFSLTEPGGTSEEERQDSTFLPCWKILSGWHWEAPGLV